MDYKARVKAAMLKHHQKLIEKPVRRAPNRDLEGPVVIAILNYCRSLGWAVDRIESKAVWSAEKAFQSTSGGV
jgi:hypothetical protein